MDQIDWRILACLQEDGRMTMSALAREVSLSIPAVTERVHRLQEHGAIAGFRAQVDPKALGYHVTALIGITVQQPVKKKFAQVLEGIPEVLECYHVTGDDSYVMKLVATDVGHLEALIARINLYGETRTSIVMSTTIAPRPVARPG